MKIVVLAGGISTERDVSLITGTKVRDALSKKGHQVVLIDAYLGYEGKLDYDSIFGESKSLLRQDAVIETSDPDIEKIKALRTGDADGFLGPNVIEICKKADIVYMGLHGADGENGKVQAAFDILGIKYTGSGCLGSALAMDKGIAKKIFASADIPAPKGFCVTKERIMPVTKEIGYPCIVKPCCGGSSVGVSIARNDEEYEKALETGFFYEDELLVEECIKGREFSVGVIDGKSLPVIEIIPKEGFYDYETKYQEGMAMDVCPAELSEELTKEMQKYAVDVYRELKLEAYARIDFLLDGENRMYCLEANTLPGMTPTSLLPQEAREVGIEYGDLCEQIIAKSLEKYSEKKKSDTGRLNYSKADMLTVWTSKMQGMTLGEIARACQGTYYGPKEQQQKEVSMITIDSRQIEDSGLFVATKGERVDGNRFVEDCYRQGALCCMSENMPTRKDRPYIVVADCFLALQEMAKLYRTKIPAKVIGITGSVGKTTTKEMIASVLSEKFPVLKTNGNYNNEIGVPLTLFRIRKEHSVAIVEMGISDFGEMSRLTAMAHPDSCVITNIGQCHLENLGDRDGVLKAKTEIFEGLTGHGTIYLNGDDDKLLTVGEKRDVTYFSMEGEQGVHCLDVKNLGLKGSLVTAEADGKTFTLNVPVPGKHMVLNALAAAAVGLDMGMSIVQIQAGIEKFKPVDGHSSLIETEEYVILDDCYNANPVSMKAGIDVLTNGLSRKVAVLGDMFELGAEERKMHFEVGEYAAQKDIDFLVCIGKLSQEIYRGALSVGMQENKVRYFETKEEAQKELPVLLRKGDTILVKASHGMDFKKIVEVLKNM